MASDAPVQDRPTEASASSESTGSTTTATPPPTVQLSQVQAPLQDAAEVLATADAEGRQPIVLVPTRASRVRIDLVVAGLLLLAPVWFADLAVAPRAVGATLAIGLIVIGVLRALFVSVPEGAQAVLLQRGRFLERVGPGVRFVRPGIVVSHVVTTRDTPFDAPSSEIATSDDVRVNVDLLVTFRIIAPERFVFSISAFDFDQVLQATCQEAIRMLVRSKASTEILDISDMDAEQLRGHIGARLDPYGVEIVRVVLTHVIPPAQFIASHEARRLATLQRAEEEELHALQALQAADREALRQQQIRARREEIELEADNEAGRIERLEALLRRYPTAMRWDVDSQRLNVARALAANSRALLQVGTPADVAGALLMQTSPNGGAAEASAATERGPASDVAEARDRELPAATRTKAPAKR
jgi:membrane protease subunit HflK